MTKAQIIQYIKSENHHAIFNLFTSGISDLDLHDALVEHCPVITQYYYIKVFKLVAQETGKFQRYLDFAENTKTSVHGSKFLFHNVLKHLYNHGELSLQHCHTLQGALPMTSWLLSIARKSF